MGQADGPKAGAPAVLGSPSTWRLLLTKQPGFLPSNSPEGSQPKRPPEGVQQGSSPPWGCRNVPAIAEAPTESRLRPPGAILVKPPEAPAPHSPRQDLSPGAVACRGDCKGQSQGRNSLSVFSGETWPRFAVTKQLGSCFQMGERAGRWLRIRI